MEIQKNNRERDLLVKQPEVSEPEKDKIKTGRPEGNITRRAMVNGISAAFFFGLLAGSGNSAKNTVMAQSNTSGSDAKAKDDGSWGVVGTVLGAPFGLSGLAPAAMAHTAISMLLNLYAPIAAAKIGSACLGISGVGFLASIYAFFTGEGSASVGFKGSAYMFSIGIALTFADNLYRWALGYTLHSDHTSGLRDETQKIVDKHLVKDLENKWNK